MARERHQHLERSQGRFEDQHGRIWLAETEVGINANGRPTTSPTCQFFPAFTAPVIPPQKYIAYDPAWPGKVTIQYDAWLSDIDAAVESEQDQLRSLAVAIYKDEAAKYIEHPSTEMLQIVRGRSLGPEPRQIPKAMAQGNPYLLGFTDEEDQRVARYLFDWNLRFQRGRAPASDVDEGEDFRPLKAAVSKSKREAVGA